MKEIRWVYRFKNFEKAFFSLKEGLEKDHLDQLQKEGMIQRFEIALELAWKTLNDRLEYESITLDKISPRNVIRTAFKYKFIEDADTWLRMIKDRNSSSHIYEKNIVDDILNSLRENYFFCLNKFYLALKKESEQL